MGKKLLKPLIHIGSLLLFLFFLFLTVRFFDIGLLIQQLRQIFFNGHWFVFLTACYLSAFVLRTMAWKMYLKGQHPFRVYLSALFYSLFINHIFPFKAGEVVRTGVLAGEPEMDIDTAAHSVIVMRLLDLACLGSLSLAGALVFGVSLDTHFLFLLVSVCFVIGLGMLWILHKKSPAFYRKHSAILEAALSLKRFPLILGLIGFSWILEAVVLYGFIKGTGLDLAFLEAIWANSLTVASGVFQFAPGGLATYESVLSFALVQTGFDWAQAYHLAIITHGYKFLFSFAAGASALILHPIPLLQLKKWTLKKGRQV
ncbi:lysylphosphatidylglycerol synthase transmembrane domain-containing protein [Planococcus lenghuensis]|uniref:Phosphatidylglycerol lysyltransferase n=1 Tax=Planococcus lenghuensis TaxID=2213202 RepID=A0A1Q2L0N0_9BACL|nr:lysylphosphatidylglycerol synthase transmembrane domain-containing protein [Planococcus lenghuensis]AQQ53452.1 hypothetical protein B0X71_10455 [Planococcus lenghuensis]